MTFDELYKIGIQELKKCSVENYVSEILYIFWYCFKMSKTDIIMKSREIPEFEKIELFMEIIEKRKLGVPLQYAIGEWEFMGINLYVGEGVLIPREDTSVLVNCVINEAEKMNNPKIIDLCSGSGCIAFALEKNLKNNPEIYGVEISEKAFKYIEKNSNKLDSKVQFLNGDIFDISNKFDDEYFDIIVSNPPYIVSNDIAYLQREVLYEPILALDGGNDGLNFYRKICMLWKNKLKNSGVLAFEVGYNQADKVKNIMTSSGFHNISLLKDINNIDRVVIGYRNN